MAANETVVKEQMIFEPLLPFNQRERIKQLKVSDNKRGLFLHG